MILIVEDDPDIAELLSVSFRKEGWQSLHAENGEKALALMADNIVSLCVLDLMLPGMDGLAVLRALRARPKSAALPVIIASARGEEADIVAGLDLGADDYIAKPFSPKVLVARIRSILRRAEGAKRQGEVQASDEDRLEVGGIILDPLRHEVSAHGQLVDLSATEFAFLELLMREPGRVFTRSQAIAKAKGEDYPVTDRSLDVHILSLRRKLGEAGALIETVRGIGYRFREKP
ncbi:MAG: DNA-binding response regulator [Spirochaetae bacterium HGW-Spirochaetae-9]|nr:MAG: DNA-binding response regulator [Spirochaetae bacterium HGW-Spirochaetae-9]